MNFPYVGTHGEESLLYESEGTIKLGDWDNQQLQGLHLFTSGLVKVEV
jgi:hypothetical protein